MDVAGSDIEYRYEVHKDWDGYVVVRMKDVLASMDLMIEAAKALGRDVSVMSAFRSNFEIMTYEFQLQMDDLGDPGCPRPDEVKLRPLDLR